MTYVTRIPGVTDTTTHAGPMSVHHNKNTHPFEPLSARPAPSQTLVGMSIVLRYAASRMSAFGGSSSPALTPRLKP